MNSLHPHFSWPAVLAGVISTGAYAYLALSSREYGDLSLGEFYVSTSVSAFCMFALFFYLQRNEKQVSVVSLLFFALIFRLCGVVSFPPLEDDFYRYLWDGFVTVNFGSPYTASPSAYFDVEGLPAVFEAVLGYINYPAVTTVYGPINQYVFALAYLISPAEVWPLQFIYLVADIGVILLLLRLASPNWVLLYAWSPLIVKEFAFTAHPDILGVLFLLLSFIFYQRKLLYYAALCLALAAGVKVFALIAAPFMLRFQWRAWGVFMLTAILICLPVGGLQAWVPQGLLAMGGGWLFNAPLFICLGPWLGVNLVKLILALIFVVVWLAYFLSLSRQPRPHRLRLDWVFALFLICSPVLNPWYWVWVLPFAMIYRAGWASVAGVALLLAYVSGINLADSSLQAYEIPTWALVIEFGFIALAIATNHWWLRHDASA